jgi:hypothetical protein
MRSRSELLEILGLIESGKLKPIVDSVYPLKDALVAQTKMLDRNRLEKLY